MIVISLAAIFSAKITGAISQRLGETTRAICFANVELQIKRYIWNAIGCFRGSNSTEKPESEWLQIITRDVPLAVDSAQLAFSVFFRIGLFFLGSCIIIGLQAPMVLSVYLFLVPGAFFCHHLFSRKIRITSKKLRAMGYRQCEELLNLLHLVPLLKVTRLFKKHDNIFLQIVDACKNCSLKATILNIDYNFAIQIFICFFHVGMLGLNIFLCYSGAISLGDVVAYYILASIVLNEMSQLLLIFPRLGSGTECLRALSPFLPYANARQSIHGATNAHCQPLPIISFQNVTFSYSRSQPPVIKNFSADFQAGSCIVLTGANGTGKSTFLKLVLGLIQPETGRVIADREHVGWLPQNISIYKGSWVENVRLNDKTITEDKIMETIRNYHLESNLGRFANKMHAPLRREALSGGELQYLGIIRALVREASIIVFDEPGNNLDKSAQEIIHNAIGKIKEKSTVFLVSHDEASLSCADRVLIFEDHTIRDIDLSTL